MKIGDEVYIHGYIDEIRNDTVIIKNDDGYFVTVEPEVVLNQPEQQWIPVSERLPEENMWTICQNNAGAMMIGKYDIEFGWMFPAYFDGTVAWMPLPEQYREEEDMKTNK